jgi:hypothetical protein
MAESGIMEIRLGGYKITTGQIKDSCKYFQKRIFKRNC